MADSWPEKQVCSVGALEFELKWSPVIKLLGDSEWNLGGDVVHFEEGSYVKLTRGHCNRSGFSRILLEAFDKPCDKCNFTINACPGYDEIMNRRNEQAMEAKVNVILKDVPLLLRTDKAVKRAQNQARWGAEWKNTTMSLDLDGQIVSMLAGTPNADLCVKCDLETIAAVTKFIVVRGFIFEYVTRKYEKKNNKDDDGEHEGDGPVQKKPKKSRRSSSSTTENKDVAHIEI